MNLARIAVSFILFMFAGTAVVIAQDGKQPTGVDAHAVYCLEVNKQSLIALNKIYANYPGAAQSKNGIAQLEQHKARVEQVNRYVTPRLNQYPPSFVKNITAKGYAEFQQGGQDAANCTIACKDDSCRAKCITQPTEVERRVSSCLHLSWLPQ